MQSIAMRAGGMAMKCPKCGTETSEDRMYCGYCGGTVREPVPSAGSSETAHELGRLTQMRPLIQNGFLRVFVKIGGVLGALFGVIFAIVGLYGIAGGTGVEFSINDRVVDGQEGGPIFLITGIVILLVGVALIYLGFKKKVVQDD